MTTQISKQIGFIGGGHMTTNLLAGLLQQQVVSPTSVFVHDRNPPKNQELAKRFGIQIAESNEELVTKCDIVVVAVKPQVMHEVLQAISAPLISTKPLLISLAAGIPIACYEKWLSSKLSIVRVMPNLPSALGLGASGLLANKNVSAADKATTEGLINAVGISAWVKTDQDIDSITALSGSGPAYFLLFIQHLASAASKAGIAPDDALRFATQTAIGSAKLVEQSDVAITELIDGICSKGGTTEQAVRSLTDAGLETIIANAFTAAKDRAEELADSYSN